MQRTFCNVSNIQYMDSTTALNIYKHRSSVFLYGEEDLYTPWPFSARQESRISKPYHLYCWSRHFTEFYSAYQRIVELCRAFSLFSLLHGVNQESYLLIFSYNYDNTKNQKYVCFHQTGVFNGQRTAICMFLYRYAYYLFAVIKYL